MYITETMDSFNCTHSHSYSVHILTANKILLENSPLFPSLSVKRVYFCTDTEKAWFATGTEFSNNCHFSRSYFLWFMEDCQKSLDLPVPTQDRDMNEKINIYL